MIGPLNKRVNRTFQPVSSLLKCQDYSKQLVVPHIIVLFRRGEALGKEGVQVKFLVKGEKLGEDGPDPGVQSVHLHHKLQLWIRVDQHRSTRKQSLNIVKAFLSNRRPYKT